MKNTGAARITSIDALRGVAVLLMMEQHIGAWMWKQPWKNLAGLLDNHPFMIGFNALGGISAPIFIVLAGFGSVMFFQKRERASQVLAGRGILIILMGYLFNLLVPSWFTPGSWYVLQLIGFSLVVSTLLNRVSTGSLLIIFTAVIIAAGCFQAYLDTPSFINNRRMGDYSMPGGVLRLALVEGHFPVLPWISFFTAGMVAARWRGQVGKRRIIVLSGLMMSAALVLSGIGMICPGSDEGGLMVRFLRLKSSFYPAYTPLTLILVSIALALIPAAEWIESKTGPFVKNPLVCLGRISLTLLIAHAVIFREVSIRTGWHKLCNAQETVLVIGAVWLGSAVLSLLWERSGYRFGLEWLIRRIQG